MPDMSTVDPGLIYALFKGEPGTRKSTAALSFPIPQYWFSWDGKMEALALPMANWGIDPKKIQYDDYDDWNKARDRLEKMITGAPGDIGFKTIVFDSITTMSDSTLRQTQKMKRGTTRQSGAAAGKMVAGIAVNELEDYAAESAAIQELIALSKDIHKFHKVNVILIAHVIQAEYKTVGGETHVSRQIVTASKKAASKIPAICKEVYHFNVEAGGFGGGKYGLLTEHTGDDFARTALPLDKKIIFGNDQLYAKYIQPAINKLKTEISKPPVITLVKPTTTGGV